MPELHIRNLPHELHERLREKAVAEGRSMSAEAIVLLRQALPDADDQPAGRLAAIERLRDIQRRSRVPSGAPPAEGLVREDRDTTS